MAIFVLCRTLKNHKLNLTQSISLTHTKLVFRCNNCCQVGSLSSLQLCIKTILNNVLNLEYRYAE